MPTENQPRFDPRAPVDFVIVGSGAAGGILAKELSTQGFDVVVLEQGPFRTAKDFTHDELSVTFLGELLGGGPEVHQQTFRDDAGKVAEVPRELPPAQYAQGVGGSSVHYTANFWRFRESDFRERSLLGPISGTNFADWPIDYEELEPYYTKVDWEIGVSGAAGPFDAPRSKPFPSRPYRSSLPVCCSNGRRRNWASTRSPRHSPSSRSRSTAGPPASIAASAWASVARSAPNRRRSRP